MKIQKRARITLCAVVIIGTVLASYFNIFYQYDRMLMDEVYQRPTTSSDKIKIIAIDEGTLSKLGTFGTWSRQTYADLINQITQNASPAVIAFDITFESSIDKAGDEAFAKACKENGNVVIANTMIFKEKVDKTDLGFLTVNPYYISGVENPFKELNKETSQGFSNAIMDKDGKVRNSMLQAFYDGKTYKSFSYEIADRYCKGRNKELTIPELDEYGRFGLNYTAKSGDYETLSLVDVLDGTVDTKTFDDCVVLIGAYASGMQDSYHVPIQTSKQMYGVEIHANLVEALINQRTYLDVPDKLAVLYTGIMIILFMLLLQKMSVVKGFLLLLVFSAGHIGFCEFLFYKKHEMPMVTLLICMIVAYICYIIIGYIMQKHRSREIEKVLKKYVAPQVVDDIIKSGDFNLHLGGETKDIAVMFVDIRGFTSLSENLQATEVVEILNEYLSLTTKAIFDNLGTLDKFVGDATMAVFNSPFDLDDYVYKAVLTAYDIAQGNNRINELALEKYNVSIGFGVGVHCGSAVIGNVGSETRMDFTAIGDTVNTASRLEGKAKAGQILISQEVASRLKGRIEVKSVGKMALKGKKEEMNVFEVVSIKEVVT